MASRSEEEKQSRPHLQVTPTVLTTIIILIKDLSYFDNIMLCLASLLYFFPAFFAQVRSQFSASLAIIISIVYLNYNDISIKNPANPATDKVRLNCSKPIPYVIELMFMWEKTGQVVSALLNYLVVHRKDQSLVSNGLPMTIKVSLWTSFVLFCAKQALMAPYAQATVSM